MASENKEKIGKDDLVITEGISGYHHYHISNKRLAYRSLCGRQVMNTSMPLERWKVPFGEHFPKPPTFCEDCDQAFRNLLG